MKKEELAGERENIFFQRFIKMSKKEAATYEEGMKATGVFTDLGIRLDSRKNHKDTRWVEITLYQKKERHES